MPSLIQIAKSFHNTESQKRSIQWFQDSTGTQKQREFALQWRNGQENGDIRFTDAFGFYKAIAHQNAALKWLEASSQPKTLEELDRLWSKSIDSPNKEIKLAVPYFNQTDNLYEPMRTCNTSSCAMVAKFLGAKISGDDEYYKYVIKYGDTTDHTAQTYALKAIDIKSTWRTDLGFADLDKTIAAGIPAVIGILHRGTLNEPEGGHMIVVIGFTAKKDYICHDPFGSLLDAGGGYTGDVNNGRRVVYPRAVLNRRWLVDGDRTGWGRLFLKDAPKSKL